MPSDYKKSTVQKLPIPKSSGVMLGEYFQSKDIGLRESHGTYIKSTLQPLTSCRGWLYLLTMGANVHENSFSECTRAKSEK